MHALNIYIVEDDMLMAASLKHMLLNLGHSVCGSSTNYNQAVAELEKMNVDLVITDIMLTGHKTGIDLGKYIKDNLNIPLIYQSSVTSNEIIGDALANYPEAYLYKPVSKASLSDAISTFNKKYFAANFRAALGY
jgi:two-component SAPR family response regulator